MVLPWLRQRVDFAVFGRKFLLYEVSRADLTCQLVSNGGIFVGVQVLYFYIEGDHWLLNSTAFASIPQPQVVKEVEFRTQLS